MPGMLTIDDRFEAIVAGEETLLKLSPMREPDPDRTTSEEEQPARNAPAEEDDGDGR
ncbi:hypothetical protein [Nocardiopsis sp. FIRDI 009]|uniref:hypothetical protein n=1 Tax=Nocardiopsis sp. FIRDI 009 TaxID=714197 RepID=UPI0018E5323E|nr:hypothetical protein [Nocardiopsis sp. FIRDI 009]